MKILKHNIYITAEFLGKFGTNRLILRYTDLKNDMKFTDYSHFTMTITPRANFVLRVKL